MKVIFGFNDIRQDGMGTEAVNLMRTLKAHGIDVQPIHPWKCIKLPGYIEEFKPIFLRDTEVEPEISTVIPDMVEAVNSDKDCTFFSHFGSPNWVATLPYLRPDIKVVVSVHSITPSALKIALAYKLRVSAFVAISEGIKNKLMTALPGRLHNRIHLITNAIDTSVYEKPKCSDVDKLRIIFFGRIEDVTKGCDKIPPIAARLKDMGVDFVWDFYGYFHWGYEGRFNELNEKYGVGDVIRYRGCLNPAEIPAVLAQYDVMVMPSNHEGFGLALVEAMAAGLPCVASHIKNVTDTIVDDGVDGILCGKNNIAGFTNAIYSLALDRKMRIKMGDCARKKVEQCFSLEKQGELYRVLFDEIVDDNTYTTDFKVKPVNQFTQADMVKSHFLARILPLKVKKFLKRYV